MQMSYANAMIGLTDTLCTIVPQYVIDRLLTTNLDVNLLWMQTKCDASLDSSFSMLMLLDEDANAIFFLVFFYDANVLCRDENAKFIHDDASAHIQTMMQMYPHRDGDATVF